MEPKRLAAEKAVEYIKDGMIVGLGTGSTAYFAIKKLGERVKKGLKVRAIASSEDSERLAMEFSIPIVQPSELKSIDITIDGADEVDNEGNLIKGGGGALLREKILAYHSKVFIVIIDESKLVGQLGKFPLPVEVTPFASELTMQSLESLDCVVKKRVKNEQDFITDNGNLIMDCHFNNIPNPAALNSKLQTIPGVVETGLFLKEMVTSILIGRSDGTIKVNSIR